MKKRDVYNLAKDRLKTIRSRCEDKKNPAWFRYGGYGIRCLLTEKDLIDAFFRDRGWKMESPSVDRKNNDGDYSRDNIRWVERKNNTRGPKNKKYDAEVVEDVIWTVRINGKLLQDFKNKCDSEGRYYSLVLQRMIEVGLYGSSNIPGGSSE